MHARRWRRGAVLGAIGVTLLFAASSVLGVAFGVPSLPLHTTPVNAAAPSSPLTRSGATTAGPRAAAVDPTFQWLNISTNPMPGARIDGNLVWDATDGYVLDFGGEDYGKIPLAYYNDTWTYSHSHWTNVTVPTDAPPAREGAMMADDPHDGYVVLFGGIPLKGTVLDDTWTYAGGTWTNITSDQDTPPPGLFWGAMAYDNATQQVILFGGVNPLIAGGDYTNETWAFQGGQWTQLSPTDSPPARNSESMVWDAQDNELLLFGGQNVSGSLNDTWEFTGTNWVELSGTGAPSARWGAGFADFPVGSEMVLYGGTSPANYDLYTYAEGTWTAYSVTPNPGQTLGLVMMTYDYSDGYVLMTQETLAYQNITWALNLTSSGPPPALSVTAQAAPLSGVAPLQVSFTSTISGGTPPYTVTWDFGDGTSPVTGPPSTAGNTSHTYETVGKYNATITVNDSAHGGPFTENWTVDVTATPPPALTLRISASPTAATVNETVSFHATPGGGTPPYTFAWTFGDGGTASTQNATHAYAGPGTFTAELLVTDHTGNTISRTVNVTVTKPGSPAAASTGWWIYAVIAAILVVVAVGVLLVTRRRKREPTPGPTPPAPSGGPPGSPPRE